MGGSGAARVARGGTTENPGEGAHAPLRLRLFVAGNAPNSTQARANLRALLREYDVHDLDLEIVDCLQDPLRALEEGVFVTPTLLKLAPSPSEIIIGTLANEERVAQALGLGPKPLLEGAHD